MERSGRSGGPGGSDTYGKSKGSATPSESENIPRRTRRTWLILFVFFLLGLPALSDRLDLPDLPGLSAQQPVSRLKGRVVTDRGARIQDAEVRAEAFYGAAAGTFAGQRTFAARVNAKGEWSILGIAPGVWMFTAYAPGYLPETVVLPNRLLTASGPNAGGQVFLWDLVLKPLQPGDEASYRVLVDAAAAARDGREADAEALLVKVPEDADAECLAAAGRVALIVHRQAAARALFTRALERDPSSYRAALGIASTFTLQRDFDSASRAFDAARNRTHDKDEQKFLSFAISDLATIRVR